jgi:hypothetical protein
MRFQVRLLYRSTDEDGDGDADEDGEGEDDDDDDDDDRHDDARQVGTGRPTATHAAQRTQGLIKL